MSHLFVVEPLQGVFSTDGYFQTIISCMGFCWTFVEFMGLWDIELFTLPPNWTWFLQPIDQISNQFKAALYNVAYENSLHMTGSKIHKKRLH